jgi:hypothetical protein
MNDMLNNLIVLLEQPSYFQLDVPIYTPVAASVRRFLHLVTVIGHVPKLLVLPRLVNA